MTPPAPFRGSPGRPKGRPKGRPDFPRQGPGDRRPRRESDQRPSGHGKWRPEKYPEKRFEKENWSRERPRRRGSEDGMVGHRGGRPRWEHRPRWEKKPGGGPRRPNRGGWREQERERPGSAPGVTPGGESFPLMETTPPPGDLVWGRHAAEAVLHSERPVHRVWCTGELRFSTRFMEVLREAKASGVVVEEVSWARLAQLCGGAVHQGIVLQTAAASSVTLKDLLGRCEQSRESPLLVAVDGITDPHNLGAIARSAEAFGGHGLVAPQRRNAGLTGSVAKVAAGALEHLPVARVVNLNRSLEQLKDAGYTIVGLAGEGGQCVVEIPAGEPLVVVVGSEGTGLSHLTRQYCHQIVRIPLRGRTPHLNAAVACGVVLYEIARQRWLGELQGSMPTPPAPERQPPTSEASEPEPETAPDPGSAPPPQQQAESPTADDHDSGHDSALEEAASPPVDEPSPDETTPDETMPDEPPPDETTPVAAPASAPGTPAPAPTSPELTWASSAADTDRHLAAHVSL